MQLSSIGGVGKESAFTMTNISKSIFIDRPLEIVFQYASDYTKWEDWFEGVSDFKTTTETLRGNGARYTYQAKMMA